MIVTSTKLVEDLFVDMFPFPNICLIFFKFSSVTSFLFVITVCAIEDVFPVLLTLYPASSKSFLASSILLLSPDPFSNSILMSSAVCVVVVYIVVVLFEIVLSSFSSVTSA